MPRPIVAAAVPVVTLLGLALPAASSAATLTPSQACYARDRVGNYQPIAGTVTGGAPGAAFQVFEVDGSATNVTGNLDGAGATSFSLRSFNIRGGFAPSKGKDVPLAVREFVNGGNGVTGQATVKGTNLALKVNIPTKAPYRAATWTVSGLNPAFGAGTIYASYTKGTKSRKVIKTVRLGTSKNACGYLRVRRVAPPNHRTGTWTIWAHLGRKFKPSKSVAYGITVYRRYVIR